MIDVREVLRAVPHFDVFCSVRELRELAESLRGDKRFEIKVVGASGKGFPVHHVRFGRGSVKALFLGFPHPNEPVGGLTVYSLLTLLKQGHPVLLDADVEWHVVPCIDPDGAMLNEGWSQQPFTLENYLQHFHRQEICEQVESSFPIRYKKLDFDKPTAENRILQGILREVRPDLYFSLHNLATGGGAWFGLTRDIVAKYHHELRGLLRQHEIPLLTGSPMEGVVQSFGAGIVGHISTKQWYDFLERTTPEPQGLMHMGGLASDYLEEIKSDAMLLLAELPFVKHPSEESSKDTGKSLRQLKLRMYADLKFVATVILEEWDKTQGDLDATSPFYRKIQQSLVSVKDKLVEGLPGWPEKTRDLLFSPVHGRIATESERLNVYLQEFFILCQNYEFVRLLKASKQTAAVKSGTQRLEAVFDELLEDIKRNIDFEKFEVIDCDTLAKVQLGSGLIVLNSILETKRNACERV